MKSQKNWILKVKCITKIVYKLSEFRSSPPEVFSKKIFRKHEATPRRTTMQKSDLNKAALQLYWNHNHARMRPPKFAETVLQRCSPRRQCSVCRLQIFGGASVRGYKKLLFTVIKRNLFTRKIRLVPPFFLLHFEFYIN